MLNIILNHVRKIFPSLTEKISCEDVKQFAPILCGLHCSQVTRPVEPSAAPAGTSPPHLDGRQDNTAFRPSLGVGGTPTGSQPERAALSAFRSHITISLHSLHFALQAFVTVLSPVFISVGVICCCFCGFLCLSPPAPASGPMSLSSWSWQKKGAGS